MEKQDAQGTDELHRHNVEHKKPDTKAYILYYSTRFRNRQHHSRAIEIITELLFGGLMTRKGHEGDF